MHVAVWQWAIIAVCAVFVGMAKTGVPGLGIMVVPMMVCVTGQVLTASGVLLPLLCSADLFAVWYYRRNASAWALWRLFPFVAIGGYGGWRVMGHVDNATLKFLVGAIVLVMVAVHVRRKSGKGDPLAPSWMLGAVYGLVAGFATMIANAAGPVMTVYLLSMSLPKDEFMGTGAWFFLMVNLSKVPAYLLLSPPIITGGSLLIDLCVLPGILLGALTGRRIYERMSQIWFERIVLSLTVISALSLLRPKLMALL